MSADRTPASTMSIISRLTIKNLIVSLCATSLAALFLVILLQWPQELVKSFLACLGVIFPVLFGVSMAVSLGPQRIVTAYWNDLQAGRKLTDAEKVREAYTCVLNFPRLQLLIGFTFWGIGTLLAAVWMAGVKHVSGYETFKLVIAGTSAGIVASLYSFYITKNVFRPLRDSFRAYHGVEGLGRGVLKIGLRTKLLVSFVSVVLVTLTLAGFMMYEKASVALERAAIDLSRPSFESLRRRLEILPIEDLSGERLLAVGGAAGVDPRASIAVLDRAGRPLAITGSDRLTPDELRRVIGERRYESSRIVSPHVFMSGELTNHPWRVVVFTPWRVLSWNLSNLVQNLVILLAFALTVAAGLSYLAADDVSRALGQIVAWAGRMAGGQIGARIAMESEDELGELAWSLNTMSLHLQEMILHVRRTSDGVDRMSADLLGVSQEVMESSDEQSSGVLEATSVIDEMNASMKGIAQNTDRLSVSAEESSSSILEMSATVEEVSGNVESLGQSVEQSVTSVEQMTGSIREVARNVEGLSEVAEETSSSMEEMVASIRQVEQNAAETKRLSTEVVDAAEQGREKVSATIHGIEAIRSATDEAARVITSLGGRAEEIGEILNVIDEVAEETNLLALNAAIIAAQAGEHGRGFSVVADEIKDLAERVGASTKEIGKLIRAVQEESGNAVGAVKRGSEMVATGVRLSQEAGSQLEAITASARKSGDMVGEIAQSTTEQSKGSRQVVNAMERVRDTVSQIRTAMDEQARGSEQVMRASESMREVAMQVRETIREQARGSGRITLNIENIREMVDQINRAIQEQRRGTEQAVMALERIRDRTERNLTAASQMASAVESLVTQAGSMGVELKQLKV